jgi:hypothetical protein
VRGGVSGEWGEKKGIPVGWMEKRDGVRKGRWERFWEVRFQRVGGFEKNRR